MKKFFLSIIIVLFTSISIGSSVFAENGFIVTSKANFKGNTTIDTRTNNKDRDLLMFVPAPYKTVEGTEYGYPGSNTVTTNISVSVDQIGKEPAVNGFSGPSNTCGIALQYSLSFVETLNNNNGQAADIYETRDNKKLFKKPTDSTQYVVLSQIYIPNGEKMEMTPGLDQFIPSGSRADKLNSSFRYLGISSNSGAFTYSLGSTNNPTSNTTFYKTWETSTTLICNNGTFGIAKNGVKQTTVTGCQFKTPLFSTTKDIFGKDTPGVQTPIGCLPGNFTGIVSVIIRILVGIAGGLTLIMLITSIISIINNSGNPAKVKEGYGNINKAIIGLTVIVLGTTILSIIGISIIDIPSLGGAGFLDIFGR